jgi:hypothetical protein
MDDRETHYHLGERERPLSNWPQLWGSWLLKERHRLVIRMTSKQMNIPLSPTCESE